MLIFEAKEHSKIVEKSNSDFDFKKLELDFSSNDNEVKFLRLHQDFVSDYFIGIDWLIEKEACLMVYPKIENLDYLSMFMKCMSDPYVSSEINKKRNREKIYEIFLDKTPIEIPANKFELTPLLIIHFLNTVKKIVKKGLKKGYISKTENLTSKIKGKILVKETIKKNHLKHRYDKTVCQFQTFTIDCPENRILKKALLFVKHYLSKVNINTDTDINSIFNYCFSAFYNVSDEIENKVIKTLKIPNFFKEYKESLNLARMIFERFAYSMKNIDNLSDTKIPPFYINMPLLFELYTLKKLRDTFNNEIIYQYHGKYGDADFLHTQTKTIIDAKYKTKYNEEYDINDIRQLSGYARDKKVLKKLEIDINNPVIADCVIIYPNMKNEKDIEKNSLKNDDIDEFVRFYKYGIKLPINE